MNRAELLQEIIRLGPWHLEIEVESGITTRVGRASCAGSGSAYGDVPFDTPCSYFQSLLAQVFPFGLQGRSVLDCACNCGAHLFWAREAGAGRCMGFDVREHWIRQARFLQARRPETSDMGFEVCDIYDIDSLGLGRFDICIFHGILYHLPDPIMGLKVVADRTNELLMINTATAPGVDDTALVVGTEDPSWIVSGVYGLNFRPTGPTVLNRILRWLGFAETRVVFWETQTPFQPSGWGRLQLLAARNAGFFQDYDAFMRIHA